MKNNGNLTQHGEDELSLWVNNDEFLHNAFQQSISRGNLKYIKQALEEAGFTYTNEQWQVLVDDFEDELELEDDDFEDEDEDEEVEMDEEAMFEEQEEDRIDEWMKGH